MSCLRHSAIRNPRSTIVWLFSFLFSLPALAGPPGAVGDIYCSLGDTVVQLDGATLEILGTFADVGSSPQGLLFAPNGDLLVTTQSAPAGHIGQYNGATGAFVRTFAVVGDGSTITDPRGMTIGPNGNLFVACPGTTHEIREFDGATGALIGTFASGPELYNPQDLAFGANGNLFVIASNNTGAGDVLEYDGATGDFVQVFSNGISNPDNSALSLAWGPNGDLFVGVGNNSFSQGARIVRLDPDFGIPFQEFGGTSVERPKDMVFGPNGHLYVADPSGHPSGVREFDVDTGFLVNLSERISDAQALAFKPPCQPITPSIAGLSPVQADNCSVVFDAEITGTGLAPGCAEVRLTKTGEPDIVGFISGGLPLESVGVDFVFDGDAVGFWDLVLTYPADGQSDTLVDAIELAQTQSCPAPQVTDVAPVATVNCSTLFDATVSGVGFLPAYTFGAEVTLTKAGEPDIIGANVEVLSDLTIVANFELAGAAPGLWDVVVTAPGGTSSTTLVGGMEISACVIGVEGDLYVGIWGGGGAPGGSKAMQFDSRTDQVVGDLVESEAAGIDYVMGLAFGGPAGNLFLADWPFQNPWNGRILEFDGVTGALVGTVASGPGIDLLRGLTFGPNGNLFVSTQYAATVLEFDAATGMPLGAFAQMNTGQQFYDLTFGPNGNLFVTVSDPHSVQEFDGTTGALVGTFAAFDGVFGRYLAFGGPHGNLFVSIDGSSSSRIIEYDGATGALVHEFPLANGSLRGLAFGTNGNLFVTHQHGSNTRGVWEYDPSTRELVGSSEIVWKPAFVTVKPFTGSFPQPGLTDLTPMQADNCGVVVGAAVTGTDLVWGAAFKLSRAGQADITASNIEFASNTDITLNWELTAAPIGPWDLVITYPDGKTAVLADAIDVTLCPQPVVNGLTPDPADNCAPLVGATISGSGFLEGSTLRLSKAGQADIAAANVDVQSGTTIVADFDVTLAAPGAWELEVIHPGGSNAGSLAAALSLTACPQPVVADFSPLQADNCNWLVGAEIAGEWFTPGMTAVLSRPGEADLPGVNVDVPSLTSMGVNFNLSGVALGLWDLTVTRPDEQAAAFAAVIEVVACDPSCQPFGNPEFEAGVSPASPAFGDLDGDGDLDLVVVARPTSGSNNILSVLLSDGNGTFALPVSYVVGETPAGVAIGDLDGDGDLDLAMNNLGGSGNSGSDDEEVSILFNNGDGTFGGLALYPVAGHTPQGIAMGDLDGDGDLDLAVTHRTPAGVHVLLNNGDGTFTSGVDNFWANSSVAHGVAVGDLDGDGDLDLAVGSSSGLRILLNNGDATFGPVSAYSPGDSDANVALGDLDGDGDLDAVLNLASQDAAAVLFNNGAGGFGTAVSYAVGSGPNVVPRDVALGDLDDDGDLDIVVANDHDRNVSVLLNDGNGTFAGQVMYEAGFAPSGVAIAPVDGDENLDIVVANKGNSFDKTSISFLPNNGDGTFHTDVRYPAGDRPFDLAAGDLDGDGDPDLAVANSGSDDVSILLNAGDGTYAAPTDFPVGGEPRSVAVGDWDGDSHLDLAVANSLSGDDDLSVLLGDGNGAFAPEVGVTVGGSRPWAVAAGDLNADGHLDLVTANRGSGDFSVLLGNGDGTFGPPTIYVGEGVNPWDVGLADLDGDGDLDVAALSHFGVADDPNLLLLVNNGDGTFVPGPAYGVGHNASSLDIADLEGDGDEDLVVTNFANSGNASIRVLLNHGDGTFADPVLYEPSSDGGGGNDYAMDVAIGDLDGDGALDLLVTNAPRHRVKFLRGSGDGTFFPGTPKFYGVGDGPWGLVMDDLDGDGRLDLAVANFGGFLDVPKPSVSVLLNRGCGFPQPCPADFDGDGQVRVPDLIFLLGTWGTCVGDCPADFDGSGDVRVPDLIFLLGEWGSCP